MDDGNFPIGFKPTMNKDGMYGEKRNDFFQHYSFLSSTYYILDKLPWDNNAVDYLWSTNMTAAREISLELQNINLKARCVCNFDI